MGLMGLETVYGYIVIALFVLLAIILLLRPISEAVYTISKNWKPALFFVVCLIGGGMFAAYAQGAGTYIPFDLKSAPTEGQIEMAIDDCKGFISAQKKQETFELILEEGSFYKPHNEKDLWETCATVFGQNYWKHDISIEGQDGGRMLCAVYENSDYSSKNVNSWCNSVFATNEG